MALFETAFDHSSHRYNLVKATANDIPAATQCINRAYDAWIEAGFKTRDKTEEEVSRYFLEDGYLIQREDHAIVGCTCIREVIPEISESQLFIPLSHKTDSGMIVTNLSEIAKLRERKCVYFYSLAILPTESGAGLGNKLFQVRWKKCKELGFEESLLETGKETWLTPWYLKLGYQIIAEKELSQELHTVIMRKAL